MAAIPSLTEPVLQKICDIIGDTGEGLTGGEIGRFLAQVGIEDLSPGGTKRHRLYDALSARQRQDGCANNVLSFVQAVIAPVNYLGKGQLFENRHNALNEALSFAGLSIGPDGTLSTARMARTVSEAEIRAKNLRNELVRRGAHAEVLRFCRVELLQDNYFHAVLAPSALLSQQKRPASGKDTGRVEKYSPRSRTSPCVPCCWGR